MFPRGIMLQNQRDLCPVLPLLARTRPSFVHMPFEWILHASFTITKAFIPRWRGGSRLGGPWPKHNNTLTFCPGMAPDEVTCPRKQNQIVSSPARTSLYAWKRVVDSSSLVYWRPMINPCWPRRRNSRRGCWSGHSQVTACASPLVSDFQASFYKRLVIFHTSTKGRCAMFTSVRLCCLSLMVCGLLFAFPSYRPTRLNKCACLTSLTMLVLQYVIPVNYNDLYTPLEVSQVVSFHVIILMKGNKVSCRVLVHPFNRIQNPQFNEKVTTPKCEWETNSNKLCALHHAIWFIIIPPNGAVITTNSVPNKVDAHATRHQQKNVGFECENKVSPRPLDQESPYSIAQTLTRHWHLDIGCIATASFHKQQRRNPHHWDHQVCTALPCILWSWRSSAVSLKMYKTSWLRQHVSVKSPHIDTNRWQVSGHALVWRCSKKDAQVRCRCALLFPWLMYATYNNCWKILSTGILKLAFLLDCRDVHLRSICSLYFKVNACMRHTGAKGHMYSQR